MTKRYLAAANRMPNGYWDEVETEKSYYENTVDPTGETLPPKGREVGEFDILLINYDDKTAFYEEVKTGRKSLGHAADQLERAEDHFEDTEWEVIGQTILER